MSATSRCCRELQEALNGGDGLATTPVWAPSRREPADTIQRLIRPADQPPPSRSVAIRRLRTDQVAMVTARAPTRTFRAGELVSAPATPTTAVFCMLAGQIRLFQVAADGRAVSIAVATPATLFGEVPEHHLRMVDTYAEALIESTVAILTGPQLRDIERRASSENPPR